MSQRNAKSPETMLPAHSIAKISCLVLFDYAAAFPSVIHMWIRMVLHAVQAPTALIYAFEHIYFSNIAIMKANGTFMEMFDVTRGVLQGDPLSAMFFNLAIDPLLWAFSKIVINPGLGTILACADDIGAALQELNTVKAISKVFKTFQRISGLALKPSKCLLILTSVVCSEHNIRIVRQWLRENIPEWADMNISDKGKYLGIYLGPKAGSVQWIAPVCKYRARVDLVASAHLPTSLSIAEYNSKCSSVLGYVAQFVPLPPKFRHSELGCIHKLLHMPNNSFSYDAVMHMEKVFGLKIASIFANSCGAIVRAAY